MELVSGAVIGILVTQLVIPNRHKPTLDLNLSIITAFLTIILFALIGIGIPGCIHTQLIDRNKLFGMANGKATLGLGIGLVFGGILSSTAINASFCIFPLPRPVHKVHREVGVILILYLSIGYSSFSIESSLIRLF